MSEMGLNHWQAIASSWEETVRPSATDEDKLLGVHDEYTELVEAWQGEDLTDKQIRRRVGEELGDLAYRIMTAMSAFGTTIEEQMERINEQNFRKYNPVINGELRDNGLDEAEAMRKMKEEWSLHRGGST